MNIEFIIINIDGYNVGIKGHFCTTWLNFETHRLAARVASHWDKWANEKK